jgi:hypothetical protein
MNFARSRRRAFCALAGLAAAYAAPALASDDKSTVGAVMDLVGVSTDQSAKNIDYSERPKLVMPPRAGELPPGTWKQARRGLHFEDILANPTGGT